MTTTATSTNEFTLGLEGLDDLDTVEAANNLPVEPKEKRFRLVIEEEENALNYVPVGVNGKVYQIMRGVEVEVPQAVLTVLEQAKAARITQTRQADGTMMSSVRQFNRYPYRVLGEVK